MTWSQIQGSLTDLRTKQESLEDELSGVESEIFNLEAAANEALDLDIDDDAKIAIGPSCVSCDQNEPEWNKRFCAECAEKVRRLFSMGLTPRQIAQSDVTLEATIEREFKKEISSHA